MKNQTTLKFDHDILGKGADSTSAGAVGSWRHETCFNSIMLETRAHTPTALKKVFDPASNFPSFSNYLYVHAPSLLLATMSSRFDSGSPQVKTALAWAQSISLKDINTSSTVGLAMMRDFMTPDISIVTRPACIEFPVLKSVDEYIDLMEGAFFPIFNECNVGVFPWLSLRFKRDADENLSIWLVVVRRRCSSVLKACKMGRRQCIARYVLKFHYKLVPVSLFVTSRV